MTKVIAAFSCYTRLFCIRATKIGVLTYFVFATIQAKPSVYSSIDTTTQYNKPPFSPRGIFISLVNLADNIHGVITKEKIERELHIKMFSARKLSNLAEVSSISMANSDSLRARTIAGLNWYFDSSLAYSETYRGRSTYNISLLSGATLQWVINNCFSKRDARNYLLSDGWVETHIGQAIQRDANVEDLYSSKDIYKKGGRTSIEFFPSQTSAEQCLNSIVIVFNKNDGAEHGHRAEQ